MASDKSAAWSLNDINRVKVLRGLGFSASKIAERFPGRTRAAVLGLIHRLKQGGDVPDKGSVFAGFSATNKAQKEFRCDACGKVYVTSWTDEQALEECRTIFGEAPPPERRAIICDHCWQAYMKDRMAEAGKASVQ